METDTAVRAKDVSFRPGQVTPEMDRRNRYIFSLSYVLIYFAAPVLYVGVFQAALCNRLGASTTVANLSLALFSFAYLTPFLLASAIPIHHDRSVLVISNVITASVAAATCGILFLPLSNHLRVAAVIGQALITGVSESVGSVYRYQCLGRGTTVAGRARTLKVAFTIGPISAVLGSLTAHFVVTRGLAGLRFPRDFGLIYLVTAACMGVVAIASHRYSLADTDEIHRPLDLHNIVEGVGSFLRNRTLIFLALAFIFWSISFDALPNLSLYARNFMESSHRELSGLILALRFGGKSISGYVLGAIALRWGIRAPIAVAVILVGISIIWTWAVPGYLMFVGFSLIGAGELGTPYFNNYAISVSPAAAGARNLALLNLSVAVAGVAPVIYGAMADKIGFPIGFSSAILAALLSLWLVSRLPARVVERNGLATVGTGE